MNWIINKINWLQTKLDWIKKIEFFYGLSMFLVPELWSKIGIRP